MSDNFVVQEVAYDRYGRMKYHPEFHSKQQTPWTVEDQNYLIENYVPLGPEQISFALERTIQTVMQRACELRKKGMMEKSVKKIYHKRIKS